MFYKLGLSNILLKISIFTTLNFFDALNNFSKFSVSLLFLFSFSRQPLSALLIIIAQMFHNKPGLLAIVDVLFCFLFCFVSFAGPHRICLLHSMAILIFHRDGVEVPSFKMMTIACHRFVGGGDCGV